MPTPTITYSPITVTETMLDIIIATTLITEHHLMAYTLE